jgi:hypothetical protein
VSDENVKQAERGVYEKFYIARYDGRDQQGGDREGAQYFVLDLDYDPFARAALFAYAKACKRKYPALARDLEAKVEEMFDRDGPLIDG